MIVLSDLSEVFLPSPDDLLVNLREAKDAIYSLLDKLPNTCKTTQNPETAFGPALDAAYKIIKNIGGRIICFLKYANNQAKRLGVYQVIIFKKSIL